MNRNDFISYVNEMICNEMVLIFQQWAHDPDTMVAPLTPKPTRKTENLVKVPSVIVSRREEDTVLKEVVLSRYRCVNGILATRTKDGSTKAKVPVPRTNPNTQEAPTNPNHTPIHHTNAMGKCATQGRH